MCPFGLSDFTRQPENSKRAHFRPLRFKHHQNSTRRHPERHKKSEMVAGEGKKSEILGGPAEGGPGVWGGEEEGGKHHS